MQKRRTRPLTAAALSVTPCQCFWCFGTGRIPNDHHERYDRCDSCGGSGVRKSSPAIPLHGQPAAQIVAEAA